MRKSNSKSIVLAVLLIVVSIMSIGCSGYRNSGESETERQTGNNLANMIMGGKTVKYDLDEIELRQMSIDYTPIVDTSEKFSDTEFLNECKERLQPYTESEKAVLYGEKGVYISTYPVYSFYVDERALNDAVRCYIFTEDMVNVGELKFSVEEDALQYRMSLSYNPSTIVETLALRPEERYILLRNENENGCLDESNMVDNDVFSITGDVYHTLNYPLLAVSYNDIINNMVWIELD